MGRKGTIIILLLILVLPVLISIFLRTFGENKFDVPLEHADGLDIEGCDNSIVPFQATAIDSLGLDYNDLTIVYISQYDLNRELLNDLRRVSENNANLPFIFLLRESNNDLNKLNNYLQENWQIYLLKNEDLEELNRCGFGNINDRSLILVDTEKHIRGYYELKEKKELDRLEGELKILTQ